MHINIVDYWLCTKVVDKDLPLVKLNVLMAQYIQWRDLSLEDKSSTLMYFLRDYLDSREREAFIEDHAAMTYTDWAAFLVDYEVKAENEPIPNQGICLFDFMIDYWMLIDTFDLNGFDPDRHSMDHTYVTKLLISTPEQLLTPADHSEVDRLTIRNLDLVVQLVHTRLAACRERLNSRRSRQVVSARQGRGSGRTRRDDVDEVQTDLLDLSSDVRTNSRERDLCDEA